VGVHEQGAVRPESPREPNDHAPIGSFNARVPREPSSQHWLLFRMKGTGPARDAAPRSSGNCVGSLRERVADGSGHARRQPAAEARELRSLIERRGVAKAPSHTPDGASWRPSAHRTRHRSARDIPVDSASFRREHTRSDSLVAWIGSTQVRKLPAPLRHSLMSGGRAVRSRRRLRAHPPSVIRPAPTRDDRRCRLSPRPPTLAPEVGPHPASSLPPARDGTGGPRHPTKTAPTIGHYPFDRLRFRALCPIRLRRSSP